jgi:hypothetical protein
MAKDARHRNADTPARPSSTPKGHAEKSKVDHQAGRADKKQTTPDVTLPGKERDVKKRKKRDRRSLQHPRGQGDEGSQGARGQGRRRGWQGGE